MGVVDDFIKLKQSYVSKGSQDCPTVSKDKIRRVLRSIDRSNEAMVEAVFALLDKMPSQFTKAARLGFKFRDGATTAHISAHIGILQRGKNTKLDREGRDYWLKPLWEIGAIEKVYFDSHSSKFLPGHPKASIVGVDQACTGYD